jgi:hypothetical protein
VRYLVDYAHPGARDYLAGVLTRYVRDFGADGVKLDGLGDVEGQLIPFSERATHLPQRWRLAPVMEIYRLVAQTLWSVKPDAFIESGWVNPATAHPYAHTFRYGDEWDTFDREYSFPGLAQHFTYAAVQRTVLGQRPHVGTVFGGFNRPIADQWLGAALALGAQVSLGSDLTFLSSEGLAALRAMLVHYRPFAGVTRTGGAAPGLLPEWASTTVGDLTFLAVLNRTAGPTTSTVRLAAAGLSEAHDGAVAFDAAAARSSRVGDLLAVEVPARSLRLITLRQTPGVVWTTSSYEVQPHPTGWRLLLRGPQDVPGRLHFHLPGGAPRAVILDGQPLPAAPAPGSPAPAGYAYDAPSGVLTVHYPHAGLPPATSPHDPGLARAIDILAP